MSAPAAKPAKRPCVLCDAAEHVCACGEKGDAGVHRSKLDAGKVVHTWVCDGCYLVEK